MALALIHTGGTIGMAPGPEGLAPQAGLLEGALQGLQRRGIAGEVTLIPLEPLIDSANATFADWNRIAEVIAAQHDRVTGFVVTHGTDTMAFTGAALCFALEGLNRPVILTGAMVPIGQPGSDGMDNLAGALAAARRAPPGVWLHFAGQLLHGARLRKVHSQRLDAFAASPSDAPPRRPGAALTLHRTGAPRIAVLTFAPGGSVPALSAALEASEAAVLRVFGAGTVPGDPAVMAMLSRAAARGVPMIAVSQAAEGGVSLGTYAAGGALRQAGVLDGGDMTAETAFAKLAHVLGLPKEQRNEALGRALCGEF